MSLKLDHVIAALPKRRQKKIRTRVQELMTLKELRLATLQTQTQLAEKLGVRQDTISRLEKRHDMLLSTMRQYVEGMGGQLELVVKFPNSSDVVINFK